MEIRPYDGGDRDAVVRLWEVCALTRPWNDPQEDIERCRRGPTSELFVGTEGGELVASVMAGNDGHRGVVYYLAVDPSRWGRGLGREMMRYAEEWLARGGAVKVNLMIREENEAVRAFYETLGYEAEPRTVMGRWLDRDDAR